MDPGLNGATARSRPRLLVVNPSPIRGGAEELLATLLARARRIDALVACLADGPFPDDLEASGVRVARLRAGRLRHPWAWARTVRRLATLARSADAVVSWQVKGHYYGTPSARLARRPAAWWDHGIRPARGDPRFVVDALLPRSLRANLVVCSSDAAAARHHRSLTIHPGIALEPYEHVRRPEARALLGVPEGEPLVGIVGRLQPWKGQHVFLSAAKHVLAHHPRARFAVVGGAIGGFDADYPARLERQARDLGIAERVSFLGHRDDVGALLPGLDCFVLASFGEPFGIVLVEAMAAGVPVVATRAGGAPEIVEHGVSGLLVPPGDETAVADAVRRFLEDPSLAGSIAAAGRARAFERFSIERCAREFEEAVEGLVRG